MIEQGDGQFPTTHWTLIARITSTDEGTAVKALDEICTQYHYPLYCYLRRRGCDHHDAQDVLHDFLAGFLRLNVLERLEESKGRLRGYLAVSIWRHLLRWRQNKSNHCLSTHGTAISLNFDAIENRYLHEQFSDQETPDRIFERKWATEMLHHVIGRLAERYENKGRSALFATLRPALERGGSLRGENTPALAVSLGISEPALRTSMSRLLDEFRDLLREEVRLTVESADEVPEEISYLMNLFQR